VPTVTHNHTDAECTELDNYITRQLGEAAAALMAQDDMPAQLRAMFQKADSKHNGGADVIRRD